MIYEYRPELHPRNRLGRFIEVLNGLKPGDKVNVTPTLGDSKTLRTNDRVTIEKRRGGGFRLRGRGGRAVDTRSADYAAKAGLTGMKEMSPEAKSKQADRVKDSFLHTVERPRKGPASPGNESTIRVRPAMSPGTEPSGMDFGMFTKKGNDAIAALIADRTKNGPLDAVGYGILQDEMEYVGTGEGGDTMVRDEVFSYLIDNGLLTPEAVKYYATDSFRDQALDRLAKATPASPQSPGTDAPKTKPITGRLDNRQLLSYKGKLAAIDAAPVGSTFTITDRDSQRVQAVFTKESDGSWTQAANQATSERRGLTASDLPAPNSNGSYEEFLATPPQSPGTDEAPILHRETKLAELVDQLIAGYGGRGEGRMQPGSDAAAGLLSQIEDQAASLADRPGGAFGSLSPTQRKALGDIATDNNFHGLAGRADIDQLFRVGPDKQTATGLDYVRIGQEVNAGGLRYKKVDTDSFVFVDEAGKPHNPDPKAALSGKELQQMVSADTQSPRSPGTTDWRRNSVPWEETVGMVGDDAVAEFTSYYNGPNGSQVETTYYVKEHPAQETNQPYDPNENYPRNEAGEPVMYSVEEVTAYTPGDDPEQMDYEYGEGSHKWFWTLDSAKEEAKRLASSDESSTLLWDGTAKSLRDRNKPLPPKSPGTNDDIVNQIMAYEQGDLTPEQVIALFQRLLDSGMVWKLQGSYGRTAQGMIDAGLITPPPPSG